MKKTILLPCLLIAGLHSTLNAQQKDTAALPVKSGNEWQMPKDVLVRSRNFADNCRKLLSLDSATTQKLFQLHLGNTKSVDEIRVGQGSDKEKKDALAANQQQFDDKVKPLLSATQFAQYLQARHSRQLQ